MVHDEPTHSTNQIGTSVTIRGEVSSHEDLVISGRVDGDVQAPEHEIVIGGEVHGDVHGRAIVVAGRVYGSVFASERIELHACSRVEGDVTTARLAMDDGACLVGAVRMGASAPSPVERDDEPDSPEPVRPATAGWQEQFRPGLSALPFR